MFGSMKRSVALATVAGALGMAGSALAASPALAAQYNLTKYSGGPAVAVGTSYSAGTSLIEFTNSTGTSVYSKCTSGTLSGATDAIVSGGPSAGLTVSGGSFGGCTVAGTPITVTGNYSPGWQLTPTSGTTSPFTGKVTNVSVTLTCGSASATFTGTLSPITETNSTSGSYITLTNAGALRSPAPAAPRCRARCT